MGKKIKKKVRDKEIFIMIDSKLFLDFCNNSSKFFNKIPIKITAILKNFIDLLTFITSLIQILASNQNCYSENLDLFYIVFDFAKPIHPFLFS